MFYSLISRLGFLGVCVHMLIACICILVVCVRIQIGCVCMPHVCVYILYPRNPNSHSICFSFVYSHVWPLFNLVFISLYICLLYLVLFCHILSLLCLLGFLLFKYHNMFILNLLCDVVALDNICLMP